MMDAVEYIKEQQRMCNILNDEGTCRCARCEFSKSGIDCTEPDDPAEAVRIVEEWSKAHPKQTNADKFKEVFGSVGLLYEMFDFNSNSYGVHHSKWWDMPYVAPKGE